MTGEEFLLSNERKTLVGKRSAISELKPCPLCGGEATLFKDNYNRLGIMCENCNLYLGIELECDVELFDGWRARIETFDEAVEAWNRRANNDK